MTYHYGNKLILAYILMYTQECLSVLFPSSLCDSQRHQTFRGTSLGLGEDREEISTTQVDMKKGSLGEISPRSRYTAA